MSVTYTDNSIGVGSIVATIYSGTGAGTPVITNAVFDDVTINMPGKVVERTDEVGKDNGWTLVANSLEAGPPVTGTATIQIPTSTTTNSLSGCWFKYAFNPSSTATAQFVICDVTDPRSKDGYYKANVTLRLSRTPPTA